jgi:hypothetical protein
VFSETEVTRFYKHMEKVVTTYKFPSTHVFNMDGTAISIAHVCDLILAPKRTKRLVPSQAGSKEKSYINVHSERKWWLHSAEVYFLPLTDVSTSGLGCTFLCSKPGWTNEVLFMVWLEHFAGHTRSSIENPVLLILNNNSIALSKLTSSVEKMELW